MLAVGWLGFTAWWIGIVITIAVVIPVVVLLANRIVSAVRVIRSYADDIADHAGNVAARLEDLHELRDTQRLARELYEQSQRVAGRSR